MGDLTKWLKACLDAIELSDWHERTCQTHQKMPPNSPLGLGGSPLSCNCRVPDFVLRDVKSKRRLIALHVPANPDAKPIEGLPGWPDKPWLYCRTCGSGEANEYPTDWPCDTLKLLALPFSARPGYREEEWRP